MYSPSLSLVGEAHGGYSQILMVAAFGGLPHKAPRSCDVFVSSMAKRAVGGTWHDAIASLTHDVAFTPLI